MFFTPKKRRRRRQSNDKSVINWIIIAVVVMALLQNAGKPHPELQKTASAIKETSLSGLADYKSKIFS